MRRRISHGGWGAAGRGGDGTWLRGLAVLIYARRTAAHETGEESLVSGGSLARSWRAPPAPVPPLAPFRFCSYHQRTPREECGSCPRLPCLPYQRLATGQPFVADRPSSLFQRPATDRRGGAPHECPRRSPPLPYGAPSSLSLADAPPPLPTFPSTRTEKTNKNDSHRDGGFEVEPRSLLRRAAPPAAHRRPDPTLHRQHADRGSSHAGAATTLALGQPSERSAPP